MKVILSYHLRMSQDASCKLRLISFAEEKSDSSAEPFTTASISAFGIYNPEKPYLYILL